MPTQSPAIQCTTVEFAFLASLLGADTLMSLPDSLQDLPAADLEAAWAQVRTRLAGRGLIAVQPDGSVVVPEPVAAVVGTCSFAPTTFVATYTTPGGEVAGHQFHVFRSSAVELVVSGEADEPICQLTELHSSGEVLRRVADIFRLRAQEGPAVPNGSLREGALRQARLLARQSGMEAAESYLVCTGMHPQTAAALAATFERPSGNGALLALKNDGRAPGTDGLGILEGENGLWLMRTVDRGGAKWVDLVPCSAAAMTEFVRAVIARALDGIHTQTWERTS